LGNVCTNADTRVANAEELVDETTGADEDCTNDPGTERAGRYTGVIVVVDDSTDLGVGRVLHESHQTLAYTTKTGLKLATKTRAASTLSS